MKSTIQLTTAQQSLLRRLARRPDECRGSARISAGWLVEKGLARVERIGEQPYYEITSAGRRLIALRQ